MQTHPAHISFYQSELLVKAVHGFLCHGKQTKGSTPSPTLPSMALLFWVPFCSPKASLEPGSSCFVCLHRSIKHLDPAKLPYSCLWLHTSAVTKATSLRTKHYSLVPLRYKAFIRNSNNHTQAKCVDMKCIFINLHPFIL